MNKLLIKLTAIMCSFIFLISTISSVNAMNISKNTEISGQILQKTITIYRIDSDGSITPIDINIEGKITDIGKYLEYKCYELFEKDIEMQNLIQKLQKKDSEHKNLDKNIGLYQVTSRGKGLHIKTKLGLNFFNSRFMLIRALLATFIISPRKGLVIGIYNDEEAFTTIDPIGKNDSTININGKHTIIVGGFFGYTTWIGRFSSVISYSLLKEDSFLRIPRTFKGICTVFFYQ